MKDVVYAGLAQLSYLNWHKLTQENLIKIGSEKLSDILSTNLTFDEIKTPFYDEMIKGNDGDYYLRKEEDKKIYSAMDKRIFYLYSEDENEPARNAKYPEFQEWEFLCGYDHKKILKEAGNIIDIDDSGFQASAFKNGNKVIIAYRGTDEGADWSKTNIPLGFNKYADQLTCVAWFYDKVKSLVSDAEIHITGHSLGGALAQFAHVYSGGIHSTKTWNGLGIGRADKSFKIHSSKTLNPRFLKNILEELKYLDGEKWTEKCKDPNADEIAKSYQDRHNKGFDDGSNAFVNLLNEEVENFKYEVDYKLKIMYKFQKNYNKSIIDEKIENIYFEKDLTPNLQRRKGIIKKADTESEAIEIDDNGSGIFRKFVSIFTKKIKVFHPIPNFLPFLDESGDIKKGDLNDVYVSNAVKTLIQNDKDLLKKSKQDLKIGKEFLSYPIVLKEKTNQENEVIEIYKKMDEFLLSELLEEEIKKYEKKWYRKNDNYAVIGSFTNYGELGGVIGGIPLKVKISIDLIKKLEGKIDIPSLNFFEKYDEKYGLKAENIPPYSCVGSILEKRKDEKVYLGELIYNLFVTERSKLDQEQDEKQSKAYQNGFEEIKEILEETIKGYTKENYEAENEFIWTGLGNQKRLVLDLGELGMKNTKEYVKSYIITELGGDLIKKLEGKIDIPSLNFFEKYDEKYGLKADNLPPYYYARVLLEADKKKKVYLGELAYKLFVIERSRIGKLENQNQVKAFQKTFEETKEIFEEIIEGYTKESYETENEFVWTGLGNQKRLLSDLGILRMTKTKDYVKSYSETEAEKEAREKKQEKLKKEIDAEEMTKLEKESEIRIKKLDEEKERREMIGSAYVDTKKTKYINCRKGSVLVESN